MSTKEYDDRIVRMGFDNAKFESGVSKSMSTLDKLNEKLKLKGASEGSANVQKEVNSIDFSSLERAISRIESRFSTMGIVGMNVIGQITNGIIGSVKQLEAATIGQIKSGGWSRAMNIANAKFQIEGLGFAWEEVEKAVSYGVKDTAYGLDAAASAASQLAASGVDFKETLETVNGQDLTAMHKSLRAISGVAAMTNSSYEDIARIFTTVAGNGRLMGDQLLQLSSRGMNAAAKLAQVMNTTEEAVRDMVSHGQIDFKTFAFAMDDAFGEHAKEANKTFTGALGNMKAALSRVGEIFASPIINKTNTLFISLTERIDEFKNKLKSIKVPRTLEEIKKQYGDISANAAAYDAILKSMDEKTIKFGDHFAEMWQSGIDAFSAMIKSVDISWFDKIVEKVDSVTVKIKEFFDIIKEIYGESAKEAADGINDATKSLLVSAEEAQAARDIIFEGKYGNGQARVDALTKLFGEGEAGAQSAKNVQAYIDSVVAAGWDFEKASIKVEESASAAGESQTDMAREVKKARIKDALDDISTSMLNLWTVAKNLGNTAKKIVGAILTAFSSVFKIDFGGVTDGVVSFTDMLVKLSEKLDVSDETAEKITGVFENLFRIIKAGGGVLVAAGTKAWEFVSAIGDSKTFKDTKKAVEDLLGELNLFGEGGFVDNITSKLTEFFDNLSVDGVASAITSLFETIQESFDNIKLPKSIEESEFITVLSDFMDGVKKVFSSEDDGKTMGEKITEVFNNIVKAINNLDIINTGKIIMSVYGIVMLFRLLQAVNDLGNLLEAVAAIPQKISVMIGQLGGMFKNIGQATVNASRALVIKAAAVAILEIAGALIIISQIPADDVYRAATVMVLITGMLALLTVFAGKTRTVGVSVKASLVSLTAFSANLIAMAALIGAMGGAIFLITAAFATINKTVDEHGEEGAKMFRNVMIALVLGIAALVAIGVQLKKDYNSATSVLPTFLAMSFIISSFGAATLMMATAMAAIAVIPKDKYTNCIEALGLFALIAGALVFASSLSTPTQMIGAGIAMVAAAAALNLLAVAIAAVAVIPTNDSVVQAVECLLGVAITMFLGMALISKAMASNLGQIAGMVVGVLLMQVVIGMILAAIMALTAVAAASPEALKQATSTMAIIIVIAGLVAAILGIGAAIASSGGGNSSDSLFAVGAAFIMVAGAIYILSLAFEKLASISSGLGQAIAIMVGFVIAIVGLTAAAAFIPGFGDAMEKVGKALLYAGAGFALVGAAVYLISAGIAKLAPAIAILAINLEALFQTIEGHWPAALVIIGAVIIVIGLISGAVIKFATVLSYLFQAVAGVITGIASLLSSASTKLKNWTSGLSTRTKTTIVALITGICAAIIKASPQILNTVGQMLIKLLSYLGSIAGDLAMGLLDFLINVINGLADAIRLNSNRIANAIYNVLYSLFTLLLSLLQEFFLMIFGDEVGSLINDKLGLDKAEQQINEFVLKRRKIAEEADQMKKDYKDSIMGVADATDEASDKTESGLDKIKNALFGSSKEQKSELDSLKDEYKDLPGYAYDAILRSKNPELFNQSGKQDAESYASGFNGAFGGISADDSDITDYLPNGFTLNNTETTDNPFATYTDDAASTVAEGSDEMYQAGDEMMGGAQDAIVDNKEETKKNIQTNFNDPAQAQVRGSRPGMYNATKYVVEGAIEALEDGKKGYCSAMVRLAKAGQKSFETQEEINSPSKVFFQNGEYIVEGLINGIVQSTDGVTSTMGGLSNAILMAFGDPFEYLSKISSGELVYDPSVRPVFDGSGLYKGASSIDSMLSQQTITVSGLSGKLAADIGTLDNTNTEVVNELRALREEMSYMQDAISDMQVVMDTGELVGVMSSPMDTALGRRAAFKQRGN